MYFLGLIHYTRSNNRIIRHYSPDLYKKEIYRSCISFIMDKLVHSTLYLDKQLKSIKRKSRSMAFKLLKLKCPEQHHAIQMRFGCIYFYEKDVFYYSYVYIGHLTSNNFKVDNRTTSIRTEVFTFKIRASGLTSESLIQR